MKTLWFVLGFAWLGVAAEEDEVGPVVKLHDGFRFVEGPAVDADGNLYFTDIPNERIYKRDAKGKLTVFREKSGRANGLWVSAQGDIVACEGGTGAVAAYSADGKTRRVLADKYDGERFNAPNDLVLDKQGGIYFTDPKFGRDRDKLPQNTHGVYYIAKDKKVTRVAEHLPLPNGVILSPDEKTLYVVTSGSDKLMAYPVTAPGRLGPGGVFYRFRQPKGRTATGGDGLTVDTDGNLYVTSRIGLQVVSPAGKLIDVIKVPETPSNVTYGGKDRRTLFVTARTSVYSIRTRARGHAFPSGKR